MSDSEELETLGVTEIDESGELLLLGDTTGFGPTSSHRCPKNPLNQIIYHYLTNATVPCYNLSIIMHSCQT